jgi:hypothetical protein
MPKVQEISPNISDAEWDVIKVILGDTLRRSYTVDSDVQGQLTLSQARPRFGADA